MKIGITYDLKASLPPGANVLDDADEEFDSQHTIDAIAGVLRGLGHTVVLLATAASFSKRCCARQPDFVFNFAEGHGVSRSREARRAGGAGDARHTIHRLRSVHDGDHAG